MLGLKEAADKLARANGMKWYGYVLRRPEKDVSMKAMVHELDGKRKQCRPKMKWREQIEESMRRIGLWKENAVDRYRKTCECCKMHPATYIQWGNLSRIKFGLLLLLKRSLKNLC